MQRSVSGELLESIHPHLPAWSVWAMEGEGGSDAVAH